MEEFDANFSEPGLSTVPTSTRQREHMSKFMNKMKMILMQTSQNTPIDAGKHEFYSETIQADDLNNGHLYSPDLGECP